MHLSRACVARILKRASKGMGQEQQKLHRKIDASFSDLGSDVWR
jgi:hypothetical protein